MCINNLNKPDFAIGQCPIINQTHSLIMVEYGGTSVCVESTVRIYKIDLRHFKTLSSSQQKNVITLNLVVYKEEETKMIFSSTYYTYLMLFTSIVHPRTLLPLYRPEDHSSSQFVPINVPLFFLSPSPPHYSIEEHKHLETEKKKKTKWMHNSTMSRWKEEKSRRDNRDHLHKTTITNENYHTKPNKTITKTKRNKKQNKCIKTI